MSLPRNFWITPPSSFLALGEGIGDYALSAKKKMTKTSDTDPDGPSPASDATENPSRPITDPGLTAPSGEVDPAFIKMLMAGIGGRREGPTNIEPVTSAESRGELAAAYHAGPRAVPLSRDTQPGFEAAVIPPPDARHEPTVQLPHAPGKPGGLLSDEPAPGYESESPRLPVRSPLIAWAALTVLVLGAVGVLLLNRRTSNEGTTAPSASASSPLPRPSVAARESATAPIASIPVPTAPIPAPKPSDVALPLRPPPRSSAAIPTSKLIARPPISSQAPRATTSPPRPPIDLPPEN